MYQNRKSSYETVKRKGNGVYNKASVRQQCSKNNVIIKRTNKNYDLDKNRE